MRPARAAAWIALALVGAVAAFRWLAVPWEVAGSSMEPALAPGDRVLVDVWSYRQRAPREGEIALFSLPAGASAVKRVVAPPAGLLPDSCWVLGDNRASSGDSREFGPVHRERFRGRVVWRYWPPSRFGAVR